MSAEPAPNVQEGEEVVEKAISNIQDIREPSNKDKFLTADEQAAKKKQKYQTRKRQKKSERDQGILQSELDMDIFDPSKYEVDADLEDAVWTEVDVNTNKSKIMEESDCKDNC